ncbi:penicillin-binding protein 1A [Pleionea litopenaei]|uniref:Penicillin-binding protein 1A n=1 Tax=Pleionea litopenaei TaxID=3070815 RepID=A0AA51RRU0_9GAMM|nr:penicillin-binding protein 1A [Pleionea sp. HL-JVS1]WMS86451.1 penicillin-binding protein 1A [Pleionea sp. HL-JVS1]
MKYLLSAINKGVYFVILFAIAGFMGFCGLYLYLGPHLPNVDSIRDIRLQTPMTVYSQEGELIAEFGDKRRIPVTLGEVPQTFIHALIATEDKRFYEHSGVDFLGVMRAFVNNITTGTRSQGASTITQLVARNVYLNRKKTFTRKFREMFLAWKIESEISKNEILELFINKAHFSHRAYGLGAAAQVYYGKELGELELHEAAVLAGIPKGESIYNPISNPDRALERRNHVLGRMLAEGYINQEQYQSAIEQPVDTRKHGADVSFSAPYLAEMVRRDMIERFGREAAYNNGLRVFTTVNNKLQVAAQAALRQSLLEYDERHGYRGPEQTIEAIETLSNDDLQSYLESLPAVALLHPAIVTSVQDQSFSALTLDKQTVELTWEDIKWASPFISSDARGPAPKTAADIVKKGDVIRLLAKPDGAFKLSQIPEVAGGFIALKPQTGAIEALVGGYDFSLNQFNMVTQARRQPGSNIKPFIYSAALEKGYTAASVLNDAPFVKEDKTAEDFWRPKNDSGRYKGPTRLRDALRFSNNSISVRLMNAINPAYAEKYLLNFGFPDEYMDPYTSLALGSASFTPLEVVRGYAVFANTGYQVEPYFIERIESANEEIIFQAEPVQVCRPCEEQLAKQAEMTAVAELTSDTEPSLTAGATEPSNQPTDWTVDYSTDEPLQPLPALPIDENKIAKRVVDERNVFIVNSMMQDVIHRGTAWRQLHNSQSPLLKRQDIGGKTGTTNDAKDAWFSGFNGDYAATAWVGFADYSLTLGNREYGGKAALPIWQKFMELALADKPHNAMAQPQGIVTARINQETGKLANSQTEKTIFEIFRSEYLPEKEPETTLPGQDDPFGEVF